MAGVDVSKYAHSPVHKAILTRDYASLGLILAALPPLCRPTEIHSEADSLAEEAKADAISAVIDRRDVPNRDTPLQLAIKLGDTAATKMLMGAGADWSLQNEQGWSALQEAICAREEEIAKIIIKHYQPTAWSKWCRRLPRLIGVLKRMRDFYMEITFNFESSIVPFISQIAPSDTYKIWKRGSNLRADMTLDGFDGFKIQRSDQSILFLGDGSDDGKVLPGTLCMISHKDKEVMNAFDGACSPATEEEIQQEVNALSRNSIFRPGIDVTQAVLVPQLNWRRKGRMESVGCWKAKVYDMHHVVVSVKSRRAPGAMKDDEFFSSCNESDTEREEYEGHMNDDEGRQLAVALKLDSLEMTADGLSDGFIEHQHSCYQQRDIPVEEICTYDNGKAKQEKKLWFGNWGKQAAKYEVQEKIAPPRCSLCFDEKASDPLEDSLSRFEGKQGRHSIEFPIMGKGNRRRKDRDLRRVVLVSEGGHQYKDNDHDNEYKKGLRPVLWLSSNFPLQTEELLPMLDILANKVKAIRRLRELLTTKLPSGTFPVQVAIPVVPTIRVLVTFTKFKELQPSDEFCTPPSSPFYSSSMGPEGTVPQPTRSWLQWIKAAAHQWASTTSVPCSSVENIQDRFVIPPDYTWITDKEKRERQKNRRKLKKARVQT